MVDIITELKENKADLEQVQAERDQYLKALKIFQTLSVICGVLLLGMGFWVYDGYKANEQLKSNLTLNDMTLMALEAERDSLLHSPRFDAGANEWEEESQVVYRVQLGSFEQYSMSEELFPEEGFWVKQEDGLTKYAIGNFVNKRKADRFCAELQKIGMKDVFVIDWSQI